MAFQGMYSIGPLAVLSMADPAAVSYTHLDVYKRQLLDSARTALAQAQAAAASRRDRKLAPELATRALLDADLARARSNEAVARAEWQQRRSEINELQRNLGMEESR